VVKRLKRGQPVEQAVEIYRGLQSDVGVSPTSLVDGQGHRLTYIERSITFFEGQLFAVTPTGVTKLDLPTKYRVQGFAANQLLLRVDEDWKGLKAGSLVGFEIANGRVIASHVLFAPGPRQSIDGVLATRGHVLAAIYDNVRGQAWSFTPSAKGWTAKRIALPDNSSVDLVSSDRLTEEAYLAVQSFTVPTTLWHVDAATGAARQAKAMPARFDAAGLVTEQFEATSKDGTKIPYFVVMRADAKRDGKTPAILYGYGGFEVPMTPSYSATIGAGWLEWGGAYVLANLRGGGEFGPEWHEAARREGHQRSFDDFIAVAEDLVARGVTSPRHLGIMGGSNGGLLVGATFVQRPDLFRAVVCQVPLLDMKRYSKLLAGASWIGEYGDPDVAADWAFISKYSPYQNVRRDAKYPRVLFTTTTRDDRVHPGHARKMVAKMKAQGHDVLYFEDVEGGHGAGSTPAQQAYMWTLTYTFLRNELK